MPEAWTRAVLRHRFAVLACWLLLAAAGALAATHLSHLLGDSFRVPGTDSARAAAILSQRFGESTDGTFTVVFRVRHPNAAVRQGLRSRLTLAAQALPHAHVSPLRTGYGIVFADVATPLDLQHAKGWTDTLRRRLAGRPAALVTGEPAIQRDLDPVFAQDLRRGESVALPIALAVLVLVFGWSLAVLVPFAVAACTVGAATLALWLLAHELSMVSYVTNLVALIGLGLAIDYSLLIVSRFREELARGEGGDAAVVRTMATAGRTVSASGIVVAIGLALLLFVPVPFIRSLGVAGLLVPLTSLAAAWTLQPVLLSLLGRRLTRRGRADGTERWARYARAVLRRRWLVLVAGTALLLACAAPVSALRLTSASIEGIPGSLESARGLKLLRDGTSAGALAPVQIVVDARGTQVRPAIGRLADELFHDREVFVVASGHGPPYVDASGRYARVIVAGRHLYGDTRTQRLVRRIRSQLVPRARFPAGARVEVGGAPAQTVDFLDRTYDAFPWLALGVLALTYLLLLRAFRSVVLPLEAVVLNVLSIAAVYGLLVAIFEWGVGYHELEGWIPVFLFAVLFGLSMDYEVFLVTRMREGWDAEHDNDRAIVHGVAHTGRVITAAAAIMIAAFGGFVAGRVAGLRELGVGLALAVLVDATVVRLLLVPALMGVVGKRNWWLPSQVARLLHTRRS